MRLIIGAVLFCVGFAGYIVDGPTAHEGISTWWLPAALGLGLVIGSIGRD